MGGLSLLILSKVFNTINTFDFECREYLLLVPGSAVASQDGGQHGEE